MINGAHFLLYSKDADADRRFLRDVLPPAEIAVHPASESFVQRHAAHELLGAVLYLMCDDLNAILKSLTAKGVGATEIEEEDACAFATSPLRS